jgi:hypothetical protein
MSSKWTTKTIPDATAGTAPKGLLEDQFVVLLLYGKNSFGDKIYSYVKINLPNLPKLKTAILAGKGFTPSDFGEVVAAGKGEPTAEVRTEVASLYQVIEGARPPVAPIENGQKKAWDEY